MMILDYTFPRLGRIYYNNKLEHKAGRMDETGMISI